MLGARASHTLPFRRKTETMTYLVHYPQPSVLSDRDDSRHPDLASAIKAVSDVIDENPHALVGWDDLANIRDEDNGEIVAALFRLDQHFTLCRETLEPKYVDEIEAIGYTVNDNDWDPYKIFRKWEVAPVG